MRADKRRYLILLIGAIAGLLAAFMQAIERFAMLENKDTILACNINSIFNCSAVLTAPQSSLFGFPNSFICMTVFTLLAGVGLIGLTKSRLTRGTLYGFQGLAFFMLVFALWFLFTSTYIIGAICLFCLICFVGLLMINGSLWRLNFSDSSAHGRFGGLLQRMTEQKFDILLWITFAVIVTFIIVQRFNTI